MVSVYCECDQLFLFVLHLCSGTDPEDVIKNAFGCFDEEGTGQIHEDRLRELLTTMGDRLTDAEVRRSLHLLSVLLTPPNGVM